MAQTLDEDALFRNDLTRLAETLVVPRIAVGQFAPSRSELMPSFPEWWTWEPSFTGHAKLRMEQRGISEIDVRAMLERATGFGRSVVEGRFTIRSRHRRRSWIVIVDPDPDIELLVIVTVYEVPA